MLKKHHYFPLITSLGSLLLIPNVYALPNPSSSSNQPLLAQTQPQSSEQLRQTAQAITVRIYAGNNSGSGVLIAKNGQTYTVITNAHVVKSGQPYRIQTPDGTTHNATVQTSEDSITGNDLALLQFNSANNYSLATLAPAEPLTPNQAVVAAGFPYDSQQLLFSEGTIALITPKPIVGGYQIGFTNPTQQGMSGGVLLNQQGQLIGILGKGNALLASAYDYQDGTRPDTAMIQQMKYANFAIPTETLNSLAQLYTDEKADNLSTIPRQVNQIAEKITVRIDRPNTHEDGSGVISGRNGQIYYVLTARHVVEGLEEVTLILPDGKSSVVKAPAITTFEGVDIALLQFTSSETYQVATLADYPLGQFKQKSSTLDIIEPLVFVSGFPFVKTGNSTRKFTAGVVYPQTLNLHSTTDQYSLTQGLELVYTSLSLPGMSGGAVLDQQGRLIGINAAAEHEDISQGEQTEDVIYFGSSLGVPIQTFLGQFQKANLNPQWFKVETQAPQALSNDQINQVLQSVFNQKPPTESSNASEWYNYGRLQARIEQYEKALESYDQAIKRNPQFYQAYYAKGRVLFNEKIAKDKEALAAFSKATEIDPKFYPGWYFKAEVLRLQNKESEALVAVDKAIQLNPENPKSFGLRGALLTTLERDPEAEEAYTEAIKLKPNVLTYLNRSYLRFFFLQDYEGAIADATQAIELQPNFSNGYLFRANARFLGGLGVQTALKDIETVIKLDPDYPVFYQLRGVIRTQIGDYPGAIADFMKVLQDPSQLKPEELINTYQLRGTAYSQLKEWNKAIADATKVIELQPDKAENYLNRGLAHYFAEDKAQAIADFSQAIKIQPDYADAYRLRGFLYFDSQDEAKGKEDLTKAIELYTQKIKENPNNPINYTWRGFCRGRLGDKKGQEEDTQKSNQIQAEGVNLLSEGTTAVQEIREKQKRMQAYYTKAIEATPNNPKPYFYRGIVVYDLRDYQTALQDFNRSIQLNPKEGEVYYHRGLTHASLKDYPKAIADYTQSLELKIFDDTKVYLNRGVIYQKQGDYEKALADYNLALQKDDQLVPAIINVGHITYEKGDVQSALQQWKKAVEISPDLAEPQFAIAVALYANGSSTQGLEIAKQVLSSNKSWANIDTLKQNLWGDKLISDAQKLLQHPEIVPILKE